MKNKIYRTALLVIMMVASLVGLILYTSKNNNPQIFYTKTNDGFAFLVSDANYIYDIAPNVNKKSINRRKSIQQYADSIGSMNIYIPFNLAETIYTNNFDISISESYSEINYSSDEKMRYDINIDSKGIVKANVFYPENKKGGYIFTLDDGDLKILKTMVSSIEKLNIEDHYFTNNHYSIVSIVINKKVINNQIFTNKDLSVIIMFSNYVTMKYISNLEPKAIEFHIPSSEYTLLGPPPPNNR